MSLIHLPNNSSRISLRALRLSVLVFILLSILASILAHRTLILRKATLKPSIPTQSQERILVLAPHPDDEVLGCGGIIQHARQQGIPVKVVFLTYGDNNQWSFLVYRKHPVIKPKAVRLMGKVRRQEAIASGKILGLEQKDLVFLGYPDFKTLNIWYAGWGASTPVKSMLSQVRAVPYETALRPGAGYKGENILEDLKSVLRSFKPTKIYVSHPADVNADHRALYLFMRVALLDLEPEMQPTVHPYLIHYHNWPLPRGYHPDKTLEPPLALMDVLQWEQVNLQKEEVARKRLAIAQHRSQFISSPGYLLTFIRASELFGDFPDLVINARTREFVLAENRLRNPKEPEEQLNEAEVASFVGIESQQLRVESNHLVVSLRLSRSLGKAVGLSFFAFGYRRDTAFQEMPKLRIRFATFWHKVYDQRRLIKSRGIVIRRNAQKITVTIPLDLLRNPEKIFTSANTYLGAVPLDGIPWRVLDLTTNNH